MYFCAMTNKRKSILQQSNTPLVFHFNALAKNYFGTLSRELNDVDLERYYFVLTLITSHENISQQFIADNIDVDKANMVRIIDYLSEKGYVKRLLNPKDRREHKIAPTAKALKLVPRLNLAFKKVNNLTLKGFTKDESKLFYEFLNRAHDNISGSSYDQYFLKYIKTNKTK